MGRNKNTSTSTVESTLTPKKKRTTRKNISGQLFMNLYNAENISWPDENGNYILTKDDTYTLLDQKGKKIREEAFDYLLPYQDSLYLARKGTKMLYIDASTKQLFFLDVDSDEVKFKTDNEEEIVDTTKLDHIKEKMTPIYPGIHKGVLEKVFKNLLFQYEIDILAKNPEEVFANSGKVSKNYKNLLYALYGVYYYLYHGQITPPLVGKKAELRSDLLQFPFLKETLPDIYLAMHELQKIKEILVNPNGEVLGYIEKKGKHYGYRTSDGERLDDVLFEDFRGPDTQGNIIIKNGGKEYFIHENFPDKDFGFDNIEEADSAWNYRAYRASEKYLIKGNASFFQMPYFETGDNSFVGIKVFDTIEKLDNNWNYILHHHTGSFLVNKEANATSSKYLHIDPLDQNNLYVVTDVQGSTLLNEQWKELLPQMHDKIQLLNDGNYKLFLGEKQGLFLVEHKVYIPCIYDLIEMVGNKRYGVSQEGQRGRINDTGAEIVPLGKYDLIDPPDRNNLYKVSKIVEENALKKVFHGMIDQEGKEIIPITCNQILLNRDGNYTTKRDGLEMNYTKEGIYFTYDQVKDRNQLQRVRLQLLRSQRWLYVDEADKNGLFKVSIINEYNQVLQGMMKDIDSVIIPCEYDKISLGRDKNYRASLPDRTHIFDREGTMITCEFGDESKRQKQESHKSYIEIINAAEWDNVETPDQNGLIKVMRIIGWRVCCGLLKDKDTILFPCEYDKISIDAENPTTYILTKWAEIRREEIQQAI